MTTIHLSGSIVSRFIDGDRRIRISVRELFAVAHSRIAQTDALLARIETELGGVDATQQQAAALRLAPPCYKHWKSAEKVLRAMVNDPRVRGNVAVFEVRRVDRLVNGRRLVTLSHAGYVLVVPEACLEDTTARSPVRSERQIREAATA